MDTISSRSSQAISPIRRIWLVGAVSVGALFALAILAQVFLAGVGIFASPSGLEMHRAFGYMLSLFPIILLALALLGRQSWRRVGVYALLLVLVGLQGVLINVPEQIGQLWMKALHPMNALLIFALCLGLLSAVWHDLREGRA